jgi:hypothetical protein
MAEGMTIAIGEKYALPPSGAQGLPARAGYVVSTDRYAIARMLPRSRGARVLADDAERA